MPGLLRSILDALVPPHEDVAIARSITEDELRRLVESRRIKEWVHVILPYQSRRVRALVRAIKFYDETAALKVLAPIAAEELMGVLEDEALSGTRKTLIVPIPSSPARLRARGYSQAARIAAAIHTAFPAGSVAFAPNILKREDRETQVRAKKSRAENIKGAFYVSKEKGSPTSFLNGVRVVLIDDVVESGSTLADARRALRAAGAHSVIGFAIAH